MVKTFCADIAIVFVGSGFLDGFQSIDQVLGHQENLQMALWLVVFDLDMHEIDLQKLSGFPNLAHQISYVCDKRSRIGQRPDVVADFRPKEVCDKAC